VRENETTLEKEATKAIRRLSIVRRTWERQKKEMNEAAEGWRDRETERLRD